MSYISVVDKDNGGVLNVFNFLSVLPSDSLAMFWIAVKIMELVDCIRLSLAGSVNNPLIVYVLSMLSICSG